MAFDSKKEDGEMPDVGCMPYLVILLISIILVTLSMMAIKKYSGLHSDDAVQKSEMLEMPNGHTYLLQDDGKLFHNPNCIQCKDSTWNVQEESIQ